MGETRHGSGEQGPSGVSQSWKSIAWNAKLALLWDHGKPEKSAPGAGMEVILCSCHSAVEHSAQTSCFMYIVIKEFLRNMAIFLYAASSYWAGTICLAL